MANNVGECIGDITISYVDVIKLVNSPYTVLGMCMLTASQYSE